MKRITLLFLVVVPMMAYAVSYDSGGFGISSTDSLTVSSITASALFKIPSNAAPRTNMTPTAVGQIVLNTADNELCFSTGTLVSTWVRVSTPTAACSH